MFNRFLKNKTSCKINNEIYTGNRRLKSNSWYKVISKLNIQKEKQITESLERAADVKKVYKSALSLLLRTSTIEQSRICQGSRGESLAVSLSLSVKRHVPAL